MPSVTISQHAADRLAERFEGAERDAVVAKCDKVANEFPNMRIAARIAKSSRRFSPDGSNGDETWAIIDSKARHVVTVMFRRSSQPRSPEKFRVARIVEVD